MRLPRTQGTRKGMPLPILVRSLTRAVRLWPHLAPGEGHFIAVLRRQDAEPVAATSRPWRPPRLPRPVETAYRTFCAEHLAAIPAGERLALIGSYLYATADFEISRT